MQINVKNPQGETITLVMEASDTIADLKAKILDQWGYSVRLKFAGSLLWYDGLTGAGLLRMKQEMDALIADLEEQPQAQLQDAQPQAQLQEQQQQ